MSYCSFCECSNSQNLTCNCGEEDIDGCEWTWGKDDILEPVRLSKENREAILNPTYSLGTAVIQGTQAFLPGNHYFWEVKFIDKVHGTDVMIGVGTSKVNFDKYDKKYVSLLGADSDTWGYSYKGCIQHSGSTFNYGARYGRGSIIGVHLDMWRGTLEFYLNRRPLGVAFHFKTQSPLFPMVSATMANTTVRLINSMSWPMSLQLSCLRTLPSSSAIAHIPGLKASWEHTVWWLKERNQKNETDTKDFGCEEYKLVIVDSEDDDDSGKV